MQPIMRQSLLSLLVISEAARVDILVGAARIRKNVRILQPANDCSAYSSPLKTCRSGSIKSNWFSDRSRTASACMSKCATEAGEVWQTERCCVFVEREGMCYHMPNMGGIRDSRDTDPYIGIATICSPPQVNVSDEEPTKLTPFPIGTKVRYHSFSKDAWMDAIVEDFVDGYYQLDVKSRANTDRVRLPDGTEVEYFSKSHGKWMRAVVEAFSDGLYMLDIRAHADPVKVRLFVQESSPQARFDNDAWQDAPQYNPVRDDPDAWHDAPQYNPVVRDDPTPLSGGLQAEVDAMKAEARSYEGEVGRCSRYKSTTETCKSGSISRYWVRLSRNVDQTRCAEKCRTLAVRTDSEICCTVDAEGCWGMYNRGGVRDSRDDDPHIGSALVCAPPIERVDSLSRSHAKWADVRDEDFLSNDAMVRGGKFLQDMFADVSPKDLRQGSLGDCWLIASIASFAIYPIAVQNIFTQQFANAKGEYSAQLWHPEKTEWVRLTIDDKVPAQSWSKAPKFVRASNAGGFWPLLLEKAFAKMLGGYKELGGHGGYTAVAYAALSGSSPNYMYWWVESENKWAKSECSGLGDTKYKGRMRRDQIWDLLYDSYEGNKLLSGSCCKKGVLRDGNGERGFAGEVVKDNGLFDDHAYSILAVKHIEPGRKTKYCVNEENGRVVNDVLCRGAGDGSYEERTAAINSIRVPLRLVQVRNPWGNEKKFTGEWSYADRSTWSKHPDVKSILDYRDEADGTWWMTYEELERTFRKIYVGMAVASQASHQSVTPWITKSHIAQFVLF